MATNVFTFPSMKRNGYIRDVCLKPTSHCGNDSAVSEERCRSSFAGFPYSLRRTYGAAKEIHHTPRACISFETIFIDLTLYTEKMIDEFFTEITDEYIQL